MGWQDKALKKHRMEKQVEEIMKSPEYKKREQEMEEQWLSNSIGRFAFMMCGYLETRHGYKKEGLKRFLSFLNTSLWALGEEKDFFEENDKYFKEQYDLDVLAELGMKLEKK